MTGIESEESISGNEETETATEEISTEIITEGNLQETEIPKENIEQAVTENESEKETEEIIIPETEEEIKNSLFPEESLLTRLESGREYSVQILEGESVWFFFDVAESGEYHFVSEGSADTRASLYNATENMVGSNNDRTESDKNFDLTCYLEAGNRYYLETALAAGITGSYQVSVEKVEAEPETEAETETEIESEIAVQEQTESNAAYLDMDENEVTNLYVETDRICLKECIGRFYPRLEIHYKDEIWENYYWQNIESLDTFYDSKNHETKMSIICPSGKEIVYSDLENAECGNYTLYASCAGKTIEIPFKLISLEEEKGKAKKLDLSEEEGSESIISGYENLSLYHFIVPESDWYYFNWDYSSWTCMEIYKRTETGYWDLVNGTGYYHSEMDTYLEKDAEYYVVFKTMNKKDTEVSISYMKNPSIERIEWAKSELEIERTYENVKKIKDDFSSVAVDFGLEADIFYKGGKKDRIIFYNRTAKDSLGNELKWSVLNAEGQDITGKVIGEGTSILKVEVVSNPEVSATCELHATNPENAMKDSKLDTTFNINSTKGYYISPEKTGIYNFKVLSGDITFDWFLYDASDNFGKYDGCLASSMYGRKNEFVNINSVNCKLEAGKDYWLSFEGGGYFSSYCHVIDKPATCGTIGSRHLECTICGDKVPQEPIWETGEHNYQWITDKNATCGTVGSKHQECTVCHTRGREAEIPATGKHHYEMTVLWEATCGTWGYQHQECTVCHKSGDEESVAPTGKHTYGSYKTVKAATVLAEGKEERTCNVCGNKESRNIEKLTAKISVSYKSVSVVAGSSAAGPKVTYAKGDKIAGWKTSNKAVATVDKNGKITGKKAGTATITVTLKSKKTAKIKVTVKKKVAATRVKLNKTSLTLKKGKSFQLKATVTPKNTTDKVTYKTSNKNIVTVTSKGKLVAKKKGKATITVTAGKKKATCRVTVK